MLDNCIISGFADEIDASLTRQIKVLQELGQTYIEFRGANGLGVASHTLDTIREVKCALDLAGIKISAIGSPIGKISITDDFAPHFALFQHVVKIAKEMNTRYIRMFSFFIPEGHKPEQYEDEVIYRIGKFVEYAKTQDVVLLHENEKEIYGDNAARCLKLMERFYGKHFQCIFDFANFIQCKQDTRKAYEMLKPYIAYLHIKDAIWETGEVVPPGAGDGNLLPILKKLDENGYEGFLSLEPHLANFGALPTLERHATIRKSNDGALAYAVAYEALSNILER